jgi:EAL domain-containing protein (putative c-di-GMP-specific phosphodiesterase class I)
LSSLAYLKNLPATELKIDKAFVLNIAESQRDSLLVRSTIDLGHSLGMQVTAEGVETETALSLLALMGCDAAQGYFIGRPMPLGDLFEFLKRGLEQAIQITPAGSLAVAGTLRNIHS